MSDSNQQNLGAPRNFEPYGASNLSTTNPVDTQGGGHPMQPSGITGQERTPISNAQPTRDPLADVDPLRVPPRMGVPVFPVEIGRSDLDPFRFDPSGTGGMIFDPFRNMPHRDIPGNLPPGAVPPGARFDPFGPPNPDDLMPRSRVGPNPSNLRKPEFGDGGDFGGFGRGGFGGGGGGFM